MKAEAEPSSMSEGRALLTEREREALAGEETGSYRYKTRTYLRNRLEKLERDAELLAEHEPELFDRLQAAVCDDVDDGQALDDTTDAGRVTDETAAQTGETGPSAETGEAHAPDETGHDEPDTAATDDALADAVDRVAAEWEDTDDRLAARKAAARAVLDYAREHGSVSKQEAKEEVYPEYPVADQNPRTWYRKNIRPVLNDAAEYDASARAYRLTDV